MDRIHICFGDGSDDLTRPQVHIEHLEHHGPLGLCCDGREIRGIHLLAYGTVDLRGIHGPPHNQDQHPDDDEREQYYRNLSPKVVPKLMVETGDRDDEENEEEQ